MIPSKATLDRFNSEAFNASNALPYATIEETRFPIINIKIHAVSPSRQQMAAYLELLYHVIFRSTTKRVSLIFDVTEAKFLDKESQKMLRMWLAENAQLIKHHISSASYVCNSIPGFVTLKGLVSLVNSPIPIRTFRRYEKAFEWGISMSRITNNQTKEAIHVSKSLYPILHAEVDGSFKPYIICDQFSLIVARISKHDQITIILDLSNCSFLNSYRVINTILSEKILAGRVNRLAFYFSSNCKKRSLKYIFFNRTSRIKFFSDYEKTLNWCWSGIGH